MQLENAQKQYQEKYSISNVNLPNVGYYIAALRVFQKHEKYYAWKIVKKVG